MTNFAAGLVAVIVAMLGWGTIERNADYRSEVVMFSDVVTKRPANFRAHNSLGAALTQQGKLEEAKEHFIKAVQIDPHLVGSLENLEFMHKHFPVRTDEIEIPRSAL